MLDIPIQSECKKKLFSFFNFFLFASFLIFMPSCRNGNYLLNQYPDAIPKVIFEKKEIGIALILGGGGARGMFHVGVLEILQEAKIPIDLIVGCSAGAVVGALYADYPDGQYVKDLLLPLKRKDLLEINLLSCRFGLCKGIGLRRFLYKHLHAKNFEELQIPFLAVATDLQAGEIVVLGSGPIVPSVHASCAVPLFFEPIKMHGRILVDGGVLDPNPVNAAKAYSPKMIIAVDLVELLPVTKPTNLFQIATRSAEIIHLCQSRNCLKDADVIIRPFLHPIGMFDDSCTQKLYEDGKRAARAALPEILKLYEMRICPSQF